MMLMMGNYQDLKGLDDHGYVHLEGVRREELDVVP